MSKIKTREIAEKGIKTLDKAAIVSERMKSAYIRTREQAVDTVASRQESANDYAGDQMEHTAEDFSREVVHDVGSGTQSAVQKGRQVFQKQREKAVKKESENTPPQPDKPSPTTEQPLTESIELRSTRNGSEPTVQNERLPQTVERLPQQTRDEALLQPIKPTATYTNQGQPISPALENYDPSYPAIQSQAAKSPLERGRDLAKKRAEVRTEKNRRVKNQPACVPATPTPREDPQKVIHASTPAPAETPASVQTARQAPRRTGNGRTVRNDIKKIPERTIKTTQRTIKTAQKTKAAVKTAEQTARATIKTAEATAKAAQKSAQAAARAEKVAVQTTRASAKAAAVTAKAVAKAAVMAVKASIAAIKGLITALAAGGGIAGIVIVVICLVGLLVGSVFGIFFSGEDTGSGQTMQTAVREINAEYEDKLTEIRAGNPHDVLEMSGSRTVWREVLAVYAVKTTTDPNNPQDVASMDDGKKALLKEIFWAMHTVSYTTAVETRDIVTETDDGSGNIVETSTPTEVTVLYITVAHKTASEMADSYGFTDEQKAQLAQLLDEEYQSLWSAVLYGIGTGDGQIVEVALAQIGNSGDNYWSWYGFDSRVEWCACFVSWCANECGFIDAGIIPKFSSCSNGMEWFQTHGLWQDNSYEPRPGDIIFFDWDERNVGQDGVPNHVGIVEKVENGYVYTVEGNSGDMCRENRYAIGYYEILGYGVPSY